MVKVFGLHSLIADAEIDCVDQRKAGRKEERERGKKQERQRPARMAAAARCSRTNSSQSSSSSQFEDCPEVWWSIILKRRMMTT